MADMLQTRAGMMNRDIDLKKAIHTGAVKRIQPKLMTMGTTLLGLLTIMWSTGTGADVMKRIAAPMVGGITTSVAMELVLYPVIFYLWRRTSLPQAEELVTLPTSR